MSSKLTGMDEDPQFTSQLNLIGKRIWLDLKNDLNSNVVRRGGLA